MLIAGSQRYPVVFAYICYILDILFMSLAYVAAKLFINVFIFIYAGGHLGFFHFEHFLDLNPFFCSSSYFVSKKERK